MSEIFLNFSPNRVGPTVRINIFYIHMLNLIVKTIHIETKIWGHPVEGEDSKLRGHPFGVVLILNKWTPP